MAEETLQEEESQEPHGEVDSTDWKEVSRKWEARSKANMERVRELEKSLEESAAKLAEADAQRQTALDDLAALKQQQETEKLRKVIASKVGVPADLVSGSTEEEMEDFAKRLAEYARPVAPQVKGAGHFDHDPDPRDAKANFAKEVFSKISTQ